MNDQSRPHIWLEQLKRPVDATLYVWAPTGDLAFARATSSIGDGVREAWSKGWKTFKWAIPFEMARDYVPIANDEAVMTQATLTLLVERFRHKKHPEAHAARFASIADQERYLTRLPHLAVTADELGSIEEDGA